MLSKFDPALVRKALAAAQLAPTAFLRTLRELPRSERDAWFDRVFELGALPDDGLELPRGCVPYLPASVNTLLQMVERAELGAEDVFVDIGCGLGRALLLAHFVSGARAIGIEIQSHLVRATRELAARLNAPGVSVIEGDAANLVDQLHVGSVFFLYCPFSGARLDQVVSALEPIARTRPIRVCTVDLELPGRPWLSPVFQADELAIYRSHSTA